MVEVQEILLFNSQLATYKCRCDPADHEAIAHHLDPSSMLW